MGDCIIYAAGYSPAMGYCIRTLKYAGITILSEPSMQVTHLLLPVPSFTPDGTIVGGGNLRTLLTLLPRNIIVIGGNLDRPEQVFFSDGYAIVGKDGKYGVIDKKGNYVLEPKFDHIGRIIYSEPQDSY